MEIIGLLVIVALFAVGMLIHGMCEPTSSDSENATGSPRLIKEESDGDANSTWTNYYYSDGTGITIKKHYRCGEVHKTTRSGFKWDRKTGCCTSFCEPYEEVV